MAVKVEVSAPVATQLSVEAVRTLLEPRPGPCLSLYMPTHPVVPDSTVDLPTFRQLTETLELVLLEAAHPRSRIDRLVGPFRRLADDAHFWRHTAAGLAVLTDDEAATLFLLRRPVRPLAAVGPRFHTLPLVRLVSASERMRLLVLTSREARIYGATVWHDHAGAALGPLEPLRFAPAPGREPPAVLRREDVTTVEALEAHRVKRGMGPTGKGGVVAVHGGVGSKRDDVDADTDIFLRYVAATVTAQASRLPLALVAARPVAARYRRLADHPQLLEEHVASDPHLMSAEELAARVLPLFTRARSATIERELRRFALDRGRDLASGDLAEVARAAVAGRVATLLLEADRLEPGHFDDVGGAVEFGGVHAGPPARGTLPVNDVLGDVAECVVRHGGAVLAVPRIMMPTESGAAAIYRYRSA